MQELTEKEKRPISNAAKKQQALLRLMAVITALRAPDGCPWDKVQTNKSLLPSFLEEAYEMMDAIENGSIEDAREEIGDVLLHVLMQSSIFEEQKLFDIADVAEGVSDKLVGRHPHVFGDVKVNSVEDVLTNWEALKKKEKAATRESVLDGIPKTLPALSQAEAMQRKAAKQGFDWDEIGPVEEKVQEEIKELKEARKEANPEHIAEEYGDLLFAMVNLGRFLKVDPEQSLRAANQKFQRRFKYVEKRMKELGRQMKETPLNELDAYWEEAKKLERQKS